MKTIKKKRNKLMAITVNKICWFYENEKSIDLIVECRKDGLYHQTQIIRVRKALLRKLEL